jgi:exodeoxyribonuclease V alpha subunit
METKDCRIAREYDPSQVDAIEFATKRRVCLISGGAGTGKTTIIEEIANRLEESGTPVKLCAFAGKAAARLKEATGRQAATIHRMLGFNGERYLERDLSQYAVICDEASMVAADLMAEIVTRKPSKLILVGDQAQLPPVGKGQPFHDLLKFKPDICRHLTTCWRNAEAVFKAATAIRSGDMPAQHEQTENEKWEILKTGDPTQTHRVILQQVRAGEFDFDKDIILCPQTGKRNPELPCCVASLNKDIVGIVNPRGNDSDKWQVGDRVINTKNYPDADVWNGTTGSIHAIDHKEEIWVKLDTPIIDMEATKDFSKPVMKDKVLFGKDMKKSLQLAYVLTVHKSQGSQYRKVMFVALERDSFALMKRSLIYTAVTRTKKECVVIGQIRALMKGVQELDHKRTVIQEMATTAQLEANA